MWNSGRKYFIIGILCLAIALGTIIAAYLRHRATRGPETTSAVSTAGTTTESPDTGTTVQSTGSGKAASTQQPAESKVTSKGSGTDEATKKTDDPFDYGRTPVVRGDANPQVASVVEAARTKSHPERFSAMILPKPFNLEDYKSNPSLYLNVVEPGRVNQPSQPGPGVPTIKPASDTHLEVAQGESVILRVQALPEMPVTWTSFDLGKFQNELTSVTVQADGQGFAETKFFGTSGTIEDVHILCACPVTAGQIRYTIRVTKP